MLEISSQAYVDFSCVSQETWKLPVWANKKCLSIHTCVRRRYSIFIKGGKYRTFRLRDSYHFPIASGLEIGRQEVFSSTWQLLEQTILTATAQDFTATVSENQRIFIQRRASKHNFFTVDKTVFQNSRGFIVECKDILKPKFLYNNRKNQFVGCDDIMSLHFNEKFNFYLS